MLHGGQPAHSCERRDWRKVPGSFEGIASLPNANTWWAYPLYINGPSCAVKMLERVPGGGGGGQPQYSLFPAGRTLSSHSNPP